MFLKSENFYFSRKDFSCIKKIKKRIQTIQEKVKIIEDTTIRKSLESLIGGKLFELGLINYPKDFRKQDIKTKKFFS